jgi:predicted ATPase
MPKKKSPSAGTAIDAVRWTHEQSMLFNDPDSPFHAAVADGAPGLIVVTGENASGKSLFVQITESVLRRADVTPVSVSIRERTGGGTREMGRVAQAMMFGEEETQSTGATSVQVVKTAFRNLDRDGGATLTLDEPEIGLSDGYTRAFGQFIGQQARSVPDACRGVIVVTHSRSLATGLLAGYEETPTHVAVRADAPAEAGLQQWLDSVEHRTVDDLLALPDVGLSRFRQVIKLTGS